MKVLTIIGARPQFIKAAVVSRAFKEHRPDVQEIIVHTGQHYDSNMSEVFFDELEIPKPDYNLGIGGGTHGQNTGRMIEKLEGLMMEVQPQWVLVYGDTDSTLAGALAAAKLHIPVGHVEAGLRSFNRKMPEEQNRIVTDHLADVLFTPTDTATTRLRAEGISVSHIHQVGDVMYDAVLHYGRLADERSTIIDRMGLDRDGYVLATVHRAENTDSPARLKSIMEGLDIVAQSRIPVILPLHPRTRGALNRCGVYPENVRLIDPVGYLDMVALESRALVIATDSGGVQKEAYFHGVPCVTLRDETEWVELVDMGWNRLAISDSKHIATSILAATGSTGSVGEPYGDGSASEKIARYLLAV